MTEADSGLLPSDFAGERGDFLEGLAYAINNFMALEAPTYEDWLRVVAAYGAYRSLWPVKAYRQEHFQTEAKLDEVVDRYQQLQQKWHKKSPAYKKWNRGYSKWHVALTRKGYRVYTDADAEAGIKPVPVEVTCMCTYKYDGENLIKRKTKVLAGVPKASK